MPDLGSYSKALAIICKQLFMLIILVEIVSGSLYKANQFTTLHANNIDKTITNSPYLWIVQFYNTHCGHSVAFVPRWKIFAKRIQGWNYIVRCAVIDCKESNAALDKCINTYGVKGTPEMKIYRPYYKFGNPVRQASQDHVDMMSGVVEVLKELQVSNAFTVPNVNLLPLEKNSPEHLLSVSPPDAEYGVILSLHFLDAAFSMLDLGSLPNVHVRHVENDNFHGLTFAKKNSDISFSIPLADNRKIETVANVIKKVIEQDAVSDTVYMEDVQNVVLMALGSEILKSKHLSKGSIFLISDFVKTLRESYLWSQGMGSFLSQVHNYFQNVKEFSEKEYKELLKNALHSNKLTEGGATKCDEGDSSYTGYSCGLWSLFHSLTMQTFSKDVNGTQINSAQLLPLIVNYIEIFFQCSNCFKSFNDLYNSNKMYINNSENQVLALVFIHNYFLKGMVEGTVENMAAFWYPNIWRCPSCWQGSPLEMNTDETLSYMTDVYSTFISQTDILAQSETEKLEVDIDVLDILLSTFVLGGCVFLIRKFSVIRRVKTKIMRVFW